MDCYSFLIPINISVHVLFFKYYLNRRFALMYLNSFTHKGLIIGLLTLPFTLISAPMLVIDSADYDIGEVYQHDTKSVNHTFQIKNIGDSTLIIKDVKASCGCTTVGHDSIIQPGKTGIVSQEINTLNMHSGTFRKYVTIFSNAKNNAEVKISLGGTFKTVIELSKQEIRLISTDQKVWSDSFKLSTEKKDLAITELSFKPYDNQSKGAPTWQTDLRIFPKYTFSKSDSVNKQSTVYNMKIFVINKDPQPKFGEFVIKTNHQKMTEIKVVGSIEGLK